MTDLDAAIREKFTFAEPVEIEDEPEAHKVYLKVGVQRFTVMDSAENEEHAEWFRDMLAKALGSMVREIQDEGLRNDR